MKINPSDKVETVEVVLDENRFPIAFANRLKELTDPQYGCGMTEEEARRDIATTPFVLEIFYQTGLGLFALESEALDSAGESFVSPYNGEPLEEADEDNPETSAK